MNIYTKHLQFASEIHVRSFTKFGLLFENIRSNDSSISDMNVYSEHNKHHLS